MLVRIGVVSQQTGVSIDLLRSWERRYGLLTPERTGGGFRLYSEEDIQRVRRMKEFLAAGASAAEAARQVIREVAPPVPELGRPGPSMVGECKNAMADAFRSFDEAAVDATVDLALARLDLDSAIREVFLPCLRELGDDWLLGRVTIGQEHFAVNVLRGRMMGLSRGWDRGMGPRIMLACPSGEHHDISLVLFGLALRQRGWRVTFLGADTPIATVDEVSRGLHPRLRILFSAQWEEHLNLADQLSALKTPPTFIAGATGEAMAERVGLRWLSQDPVTEAEALTREFGGR